MENRNIVVIGASAGGLSAIKTLVSGLRPDLDATLFITWHMSADSKGVLQKVIEGVSVLPAGEVFDGEVFVNGRIYIAPPDRHLMIEKNRIRLTRGPKENMFRPAIDPLFRSAAYSHGRRVVGIVLSGALDDGTAGLWTIKNHGGITMVQHPLDAEHSSMPRNAIREVSIDFIATAAEMPALLSEICNVPILAPKEEMTASDQRENQLTKKEVEIGLAESEVENPPSMVGELSSIACPECHGVLSFIREGRVEHYRCHTGHAFSPESLLEALLENVEANSWAACRGLQEAAMLLNHAGDHYAEKNETQLAAKHFQKATELLKRADAIRKTILYKKVSAVDMKASRHSGL